MHLRHLGWLELDVAAVGIAAAVVAAVVGEITKLSLNASRRLKLCARHSGVTALVLRRSALGEQSPFFDESLRYAFQSDGAPFILAGIAPFMAFDVLYDPERRMIGLRLRSSP